MDEVEPDQVQPVAVEPVVATKPKPPSRSHHKAKPQVKAAPKPVGPAQTLEQELAASFGKFVNGTAANSVAAAKKVTENFLEALLESVHSDKKK